VVRRASGAAWALASALAAAASATSCAALTSWGQYVDGAHPGDGATPDVATRDGGNALDTLVSEAGAPDSMGTDATVDEGVEDVAFPDNTPSDSATSDSGPADSALPPQDSTVVDTGQIVDSSVADTSDGATVDSATTDTGVVSPPGDAAVQSFTVGGSITGLFEHDIVQLADNGAPQLFSGSGPFMFTMALPNGSPYAVTVTMNPSTPIADTCMVALGTGTVQGSNVTNVDVSCRTNSYPVSGTVTGYSGSGLQLSNGSDMITVDATDSGAAGFTFDEQVASGESYSVAVAASPGLYCNVSNGSGMVTDEPITNVSVSCVPIPACSPDCADSAGCVVNGDCGSQLCTSGVCQTPACSPGCAPGSPCGSDGDCTDGACSGTPSACN
jgi:hypothetical protein